LRGTYFDAENQGSLLQPHSVIHATHANRGIVKSEEVIPVQESFVLSDVQHEATVKTEEARDATVGVLNDHSAPEDFSLY
jgi:hypothetical protein